MIMQILLVFILGMLFVNYFEEFFMIGQLILTFLVFIVFPLAVFSGFILWAVNL